MPDPRFFSTNAALDLAEALRVASAVARGKFDSGSLIARVSTLDETNAFDTLVFVEDGAHAARLAGKRFGLCLAPADVEIGANAASGVVAACAEPRRAFAALAAALHSEREHDGGPADIAATAAVHPSATIGAGAVIGERVRIGPNAVIGPGVVIGPDGGIGPGASVFCALIGAGTIIGAGTAIGGAGFGFVMGPKGLTRIPQLGRVILGDHVEIGANCCIDRGALADTVIGMGTKIDNLVQIGHNVRLGANCVLAAQVGVAGSSTIGDRVQMGGKAGIADHLTIGDDARIAAKAGVTHHVPAGETWGGYPARPMMKWMRETAALARAAKTKKATDNDN